MDIQNKIVSVRFSLRRLDQLRLLTKIYGGSIGSLVRTAVDKYIEELVSQSDFEDKVAQMHSRNSETLHELQVHESRES